MATLEELASNEAIKEEYRRTLLLNMLKKLVGRMNKDNSFKTHITNLYKQSTDKLVTTRVIIKQNFNYDANESDTELLNLWIKAYFNKSNKRKGFPLEFKQKLYNQQKGLCAVCGEQLGNDFSKIHVDHIIPWVLVGDELKDNYQYLCSTCNESKSCHTDYIFKSLLKLN
ncbi:MAG: HNH endonuclease [Bacteroidaceae bacterium]|nr:HNH endonuclease [Bacteroidaceae bacterium]